MRVGCGDAVTGSLSSGGWHDDGVRRGVPTGFGRRADRRSSASSAPIVLVALAWSDEPATALRAAPWLALVRGACWAAVLAPEVVVDDGGVRLVNVLRTIDLPWPSIQAVDTKWALTLITAYGRFTAWAAPAPGRATRRSGRPAQDAAAPAGQRGVGTTGSGRATCRRAPSGSAATDHPATAGSSCATPATSTTRGWSTTRRTGHAGTSGTIAAGARAGRAGRRRAAGRD